MTRLHRALVALTLVAALAAALTPAAQAQGGGTRLTAKLTGTKAFPGVSGKATFSRESGRRELEVEIEHARSLHGKRLTVFVGGKKIGRWSSVRSERPASTARRSAARRCRRSPPAPA